MSISVKLLVKKNSVNKGLITKFAKKLYHENLKLYDIFAVMEAANINHTNFVLLLLYSALFLKRVDCTNHLNPNYCNRICDTTCVNSKYRHSHYLS